MLGSSTQAAAWPQPLRLAGRLFLATVLVLWSVHALGRVIVEPMIPVFRTAIGVLEDRFIITDATASPEGPNTTVRFRANLARPLRIGGEVLYPFGWDGRPKGGFQVTYTVGGVLLYGAWMLILVLAWPVRRAKELAVRLLTCVPLMATLLLIDVPASVVAELWNVINSELAPLGFNGWMIWSRFLMGGGGLVIALLMAAACIAISAQAGTVRVRAA